MEVLVNRSGVQCSVARIHSWACAPAGVTPCAQSVHVQTVLTVVGTLAVSPLSKQSANRTVLVLSPPQSLHID